MPDFAAVIDRARRDVREHLGVDVTIDGRPARVVWTVLEAAPRLGGLRQPMTEPAALILPEGAAAVERGHVLLRGAERYVIADIQPREDGWVLLVLRGEP